MKKTLLFFDIDGTLAMNDSDNRCIIPDSVTRSLALLKDKGHFIAACTGRQAAFVHDLFPGIFDAVVANSGNYVECEGKPIFESVMDRKQSDHFIELFRRFHICVALVSKDKVFVACYEEPDINRILNNYMKGTKIIFDCDDYQDVLMFDLFFHDREEYLNLKPYFTEDMIVNVHEDILLPVDVSIGNDKGSGVRRIIDHFDGECISYGFGDGYNDISLIKAADIGVAMGNSVDELKKAADYVTDDIDKDGVYKALIHFGLLEEQDESVRMQQ